MNWFLLFCGFLFGCRTCPAFAQYWFPNPGLNAMTIDIQYQAAMAQVRSQATGEAKGTPEQVAVSGASSLVYKPSLSVRKKNLAQFVAKTRAVDPQGAAKMEQIFASTDIINEMGKAIAPFGLRADNAADAYTTWWINAWQASRGRTDTLPRKQIDAVKAQAAQAMSATPLFKTASDALKQEFSEAHLIQAALIDGNMEAAKGNPAQLKAIAQAVRQGAKASGVDLDTMELGPNGFVMAAAKVTRTAIAPKTQVHSATTVAPAKALPVVTASNAMSTIQMAVFTMWGDLQYHPMVLFKDGTTYDIDDASLETSNLPLLKQQKPNSWGRWKTSGNKYFFSDSKGKVSDYVLGDGGLFRSFPAKQGAVLNASYKSVSGSGMGEMSTLSTRKLRFFPNGRFAQDNSFVASGSGDVSGVSMGGGSTSQFAGTYAISGHRIILAFNDGTKKDFFFGFGSQGTPPRPDMEMIFIGFGAYVTE
jgi:hypothetical protein